MHFVKEQLRLISNLANTLFAMFYVALGLSRYNDDVSLYNRTDIYYILDILIVTGNLF